LTAVAQSEDLVNHRLRIAADQPAIIDPVLYPEIS